jgi:hypothetical protein
MSRRKRKAAPNRAAAQETQTSKATRRKKAVNAMLIGVAAVLLSFAVFAALRDYSEKYKHLSDSKRASATLTTSLTTEPASLVQSAALPSKEYINVGGKTLAVINPNAQFYSISGWVSFGTVPDGQSAKFVQNVLLNASGTNSAFAPTDSAGSYILGDLILGGNYNVTPSKKGDINGITSFDATLVLRCVAAGDACALAPNERIAADTNSNGIITSFDATLILRYVAANQQTENTGDVGNWKFLPGLRSYSPLLGTRSGENYAAILVGEVNNSWTAPEPDAALRANGETDSTQQKEKDQSSGSAIKADNSSPDVSAAVKIPVVSASEEQQQLTEPEGMHISLPQNALITVGNTATIPIALTNNAGTQVSAFSFAVHFNPALLQPAATPIDLAGTFWSNCDAVANTVTPGRIVIAGGCRENINARVGILLKLRFAATGPISTAPLEARTLKFWQNPLFEDYRGQRIAVGRTDGSVR